MRSDAPNLLAAEMLQTTVLSIHDANPYFANSLPAPFAVHGFAHVLDTLYCPGSYSDHCSNGQHFTDPGSLVPPIERREALAPTDHSLVALPESLREMLRV